ncbi:hypothetical protein ELS19_19810 [Halogeometricum borinquense]|uniref:Uncharacterized protein n=1 Tax=Halogeometricum borinquense TaxID=60847 RepID=A0A482SX07_9EURY|nr:hypothetical protein [Halogeometricum borinquense]RYJ07764.1 hypothetical protein ELS19_19810 [Halogeometricum borinquense]
MADPFLIGTYAASISIFVAIFAVEAWYNGREPPSRDDWRALFELAKQDLADDADVVREYSVLDVARITLETVLMLGLFFRTGTHLLAYLVAVPHKRPEWTAIGFEDPVGPRPHWHRFSSLVATGVLVAFFAQHYPVGAIDSGLSPLARLGLVGWMSANALAAVCDPILLVGQARKLQTMTKTNT